jgi:peptidoglycan-associated lipoprotein
MSSAQRVGSAFLLASAIVAGACHKKPPEAAPVPVQVAATPPRNTGCDAACMKARQDSADNANRAAADEAAKAAAAAKAAITATIYFDFDASEIRSDAKQALDAKLPVLSKNTAVKIRVAGHTDERGSDEYNLALGQRRAAAAKRYLTDRGIDPSRIEIVSFGEERPADSGHDESAWAKNRRDEFEITAGGTNIVAAPTR